MEKIEDLLTALSLEQNITLENIPDIDLYMDQVIQLFENTYNSTKRDEEEKILTKTMINNYAKGKLFFPIKNKKYSKDHIILISLIYQLKGNMSIKDIKVLFEGLNEKIMTSDFALEHFYNSYLQLVNENVETFKKDVKDIAVATKSEVIKLEDKDEDYLEQVLLIASLSYMSNLYRRAVEKLVDEIIQKR
ncbi:DUF1836 domain-containing protein [Caldibacillus lycopersici]|uniref:DUF1836 domain-containing protein n=1 Tax=Perspicuibacillus lycopersici TaxID=1325689 RepID=A0AAE3ITQ0_9BACI|nr:DUF1836 domain-containing protein [Perspicuibacillus lycopersici]MCU9614453.1 DUF1836 domain-containing protein [Perspicuibacillus lycopersici]